ncbi:MAG: MerR family transcriptional regulator [Bacteroidota bacterium]
MNKKAERYSVKELAVLSGVSIRTLHYYDKIGLLKPAARTEAAYRYYEEEELLRLQQILFYKELDFSLQEIKDILDDPDFDLLEALHKHKKLLAKRQKRIKTLITTLNNTINHLKSNQPMKDPEMLYEGLPEEFGTTHRQSVIDEYGEEALSKAETALTQMGKQGFTALKNEFDQLVKQLYRHKDEDPHSLSVQELIASHYLMIRKFWGTSQEIDKQADAYAGLGQLYLADERFTLVEGKSDPTFAPFLQKAMAHYTETHLQE